MSPTYYRWRRTCEGRSAKLHSCLNRKAGLVSCGAAHAPVYCGHEKPLCLAPLPYSRLTLNRTLLSVTGCGKRRTTTTTTKAPFLTSSFFCVPFHFFTANKEALSSSISTRGFITNTSFFRSDHQSYSVFRFRLFLMVRRLPNGKNVSQSVLFIFLSLTFLSSV